MVGSGRVGPGRAGSWRKEETFFLLWTILLKCFVSELCNCFDSPLQLQEARFARNDDYSCNKKIWEPIFDLHLLMIYVAFNKNVFDSNNFMLTKTHWWMEQNCFLCDSSIHVSLYWQLCLVGLLCESSD